MVGTDSTATAVRTIFYYILTSPRVYACLQSELDAALPNISRPVISNAEAQTLSYLQACITEGLRVWPPVASLIYKLVPPEGDTWEGKSTSGGTNIGYSAWALHHSRDLYGEDADIFRPDRWLEVEVGGEKWKEMQRTVELVFGYSKYGCLRKTIAMIELNKVFAEVCYLNL